MQRILIGIIFGLGLAVGSAAGQVDHCYQYDSAKKYYLVSFTVTGDKLEGFYVSDRFNRDGKHLDFTGTKRGNVVTIVFKEKAPDDISPPPTTPSSNRHPSSGMRGATIVWTLAPKARMKVPLYVRDTGSGKYTTRTAVFGPCRDV